MWSDISFPPAEALAGPAARRSRAPDQSALVTGTTESVATTYIAMPIAHA